MLVSLEEVSGFQMHGCSDQCNTRRAMESNGGQETDDTSEDQILGFVPFHIMGPNGRHCDACQGAKSDKFILPSLWGVKQGS